MVGYPRRFLFTLWVVLAAVAATGLLMLPGALELKWEMDVPLQLPPGFRVGTAAAHALFAFLVLLFLGALYSLHMRIGWRRRENLSSGVTTVVVLGALALTGLGIYYLADDRLSLWMSGMHIALGIISIGAIAVHVILGRLVRAARLAQLKKREP